MKIEKIHHVAYRCQDAKETVEWYQKHLNMDFVLAIAENEVPRRKRQTLKCMCFRCWAGERSGFFELPTQPPMGRDQNTQNGCSILPFRLRIKRHY